MHNTTVTPGRRTTTSNEYILGYREPSGVLAQRCMKSPRSRGGGLVRRLGVFWSCPKIPGIVEPKINTYPCKPRYKSNYYVIIVMEFTSPLMGGGGVLWGVLKSQIPNYFTPQIPNP